jgi:hypothetical protein
VRWTRDRAFRRRLRETMRGEVREGRWVPAKRAIF